MAARKIFFHSEAGQVLLITVLVMAVVLTVGLSTISRSVTDVQMSKEGDDSIRALSAAEAGIEEALRLGSAPAQPISIDEGVLAYVSEETRGGGSDYVFSEPAVSGKVQTVWLVGHNDAGDPDPAEGSYANPNIWIYWGNPDAGVESLSCSGAGKPAIEAVFLYEVGGSFHAVRSVFDPDDWRRTSCNSFGTVTDKAGYSLGGIRFQYRKLVDLPLGVSYALRLRIMYADQPQVLAVSSAIGIGGSNIPNQEKCFTSSVNLESGISKRVQRCQMFESPPGIFDYVLYSDTDLAKQKTVE